MMMMTAMILATGPSTDCRIWLRGCFHGMFEPAANAGLAARQAATNTSVETILRSNGEITLMFVPYCGEAVVTGTPEACDAGELGKAAIGAATGKDGDDVDGLRNQGTRDGDDGFLDQLLEPPQCSERGARLDGADATWMSGTPGFEQVEGLRT